MVRRFEVWMTRLDPSQGSEIQKTRPCVVVSPDEINRFLKTVMIVPMTTSIKAYPTRLPCGFMGKQAELVIDQMRGIDKSRLARKMGVLDKQTSMNLCKLIQETFEY